MSNIDLINELEADILETKRDNYEQIYLFIKYSLAASLKSFITFGCKSEATKDSCRTLKEFIKIYIQERKILNFIKTNKNSVDLDMAFKMLDKLDELNEKTVRYYYDVLENIEDACELENSDRAKRPLKDFDTLIESTKMQEEAICLLETMKNIKTFLNFPDEFWEFIQPKIKVASLAPSIANEAAYIHPIINEDNLICGIDILIPEIIDYNTSLIALKLLIKAYDIYKSFGMDKVVTDDIAHELIIEEYKNSVNEKVTLTFKK